VGVTRCGRGPDAATEGACPARETPHEGILAALKTMGVFRFRRKSLWKAIHELTRLLEARGARATGTVDCPTSPSIPAPQMTIIDYAPWPVVPPSRAAIGIASRCRFRVQLQDNSVTRNSERHQQCYGDCHTPVTYRHARKKSKSDSEIVPK
jgi:hypothetical protein